MKKKIIGILVSAVMAVSSVNALAADTADTPDTVDTGNTVSTADEKINEADGTEETETSSAGIESETTNDRYKDVTSDKWYYDAADYVSDKNVMSGTAYGYFSPDLYATRGTLAQIIKNMYGESGKVYWSYLDVKEGTWYENAIAWCSDAGVMKGYGGGYFGPDDYITREQLVFTLYQYASYKGFDNLDTAGIELLDYSDYKNVSGYAGGAMQWALKNGLLYGKENKTLDPKGNATRAEVAQVLKNFMTFYKI